MLASGRVWHMIGGNWGQFVHSSFLQNASSLDMPIVVLFQREMVFVKILLEGCIYIYIHYRVDGTMLNKCVVHSFMLFLIYFCTFMLQMGSIGNHLKLSMVPFVQERKYISIHNPPGSRMSNTWTMPGALSKWHLSTKIQPEWPKEFCQDLA